MRQLRDGLFIPRLSSASGNGGDVGGDGAGAPVPSPSFIAVCAHHGLTEWSQLPCMNIAVNQLICQGSGPWQVLFTVQA